MWHKESERCIRLAQKCIRTPIATCIHITKPEGGTREMCNGFRYRIDRQTLFESRGCSWCRKSALNMDTACGSRVGIKTHQNTDKAIQYSDNIRVYSQFECWPMQFYGLDANNLFRHIPFGPPNLEVKVHVPLDLLGLLLTMLWDRIADDCFALMLDSQVYKRRT